MTSEPGQVVTVFRSRLRMNTDAYADHAARISELAQIPETAGWGSLGG
jgi:hypothetical protein